MASRKKKASTRNALTWLEFALAVALASLLGLLLLPAVEAGYESSRGGQCQSNLKNLGLAFKMYCNEGRGERFPPLSPIPANWVPDAQTLYPDFIQDLDLLACPSHPSAHGSSFRLRGTGEQHPKCVSSRYYVYTGFTIADDYDAITVHDALMQGGWNLLRDTDIHSTPPYSLDLIEGQGGGIVLWDRVSAEPGAMAHKPLGVNVLFMDGYVEFLAHEAGSGMTVFPMTEVCAELFGAVSPHLPADCAP